MPVESHKGFNAVVRKPSLGARSIQHARPRQRISALFSAEKIGRQFYGVDPIRARRDPRAIHDRRERILPPAVPGIARDNKDRFDFRYLAKS